MAKKFHFKLENVLNYRQQLEDQAAQTLAVAQRRYNAQVHVVEDLQHRLRASDAEYMSKDNLSAGEVWLWQACRDGLKRDLTQAQAMLQALAKDLQKARALAVRSAMERKVVEKLKENQAEKHVKEDGLAQQKEFDETAALRFRHTDFANP